MSRQEKKDLKQLEKRHLRDLRSVACGIMGITFGPVEVASSPYTDRSGNKVKPEPAEMMDITKVQGGCLVDTTVPVRWEMTDNREAIVGWASY